MEKAVGISFYVLNENMVEAGVLSELFILDDMEVQDGLQQRCAVLQYRLCSRCIRYLYDSVSDCLVGNY